MAGKSSVDVLEKLEIRTIGELARSDPKLLQIHLKSHGKLLWEFANGIDPTPVHTKRAEAKGIGNSITLSKDIQEGEAARKILLSLSESVGLRLRQAKQKAGMISIEIKYYDFRIVSHQKQLRKETNADIGIYQAACELFEELWNREPIRLLGVRTSKLADEGEPEQLSIFDIQYEKPKDEKHKKLDKALDEIRKRFGEQAVVRGTFLDSELKKTNSGQTNSED